ncbi:hypothetical protein ACQKNX_08310 [Lysinibacillus sp. NPDC093712]|uniref:hypothetical protein n=1 Tax=Lysinibacillus sp. NPDC093712 TaxID=3390579 RepID=UPI003D002AB0
MTIQVDYTNYDENIQSVKLPIEKDIYQLITPIVKKVEINNQTEIERYVEIAIYDERLSNVITKQYSQKEILEVIRILQRMVKEIMSDEISGNSSCK